MASANNGLFVWYELMTKDVQAAIACYGEVVGWKTQPFAEGGDYIMWVGSQGPLGGVMKLPDEAAKMGAPPHWLGYVRVEDVDATAALTKKLGGKVHKEPTDIPTVGRFAVIADQQGASIGVFKPIHEMALHDAAKEGETCWNELMTSDSIAAFKFYAQLFGGNRPRDGHGVNGDLSGLRVALELHRTHPLDVAELGEVRRAATCQFAAGSDRTARCTRAFPRRDDGERRAALRTARHRQPRARRLRGSASRTVRSG